MGMAVGGNSGGGGGRRRRGGRNKGVISEINVTPLVDVMLVLLIIFMVAAPMMTVGVPIDLPETQAKALNSETQPITISVKNSGEVYLQETPIPAVYFYNAFTQRVKEFAATMDDFSLEFLNICERNFT